MSTPSEYELLSNIGRFTGKPHARLLVAVTSKDALVGVVLHALTYVTSKTEGS